MEYFGLCYGCCVIDVHQLDLKREKKIAFQKKIEVDVKQFSNNLANPISFLKVKNHIPFISFYRA